MTKPATIKLFLVTGQPDGLRTAEISNWSGIAVAGPRSDLTALKARQELKSPGLYFLIGEDEASDSTRIYIGESENVAKRLGGRDHTGKEFWVSAICFVSKDNNLTKGHINYLEGQLIKRAKELKIPAENGQGSGSSLPESDIADMDEFLAKIYQLLPILGLRVFEVPEKVNPDADDWLYCSIKGLQAKGRRTANGFLVAAGSQAVKAHRPSSKRWAKKRETMVDNGELIDRGEYLEFSRDLELTSPSTAGSIVCAGSTNGLKAWKNKQESP
ncbi:MAG: GIY-YIG nuclease family protein [Gammaproteobacteria bacterium]